MSKKVYITGVSGTGKSTIVKEFTKRNIFSFDIDEVEGLCGWVNRKTQKKVNDYQPSREWLEAQDWICDITKLKCLLAHDTDLIIAAGVATNQDEYLVLFDQVFLLKCDPAVSLQRIEYRFQTGRNNFGRHPEEREFVLRGREDYENKLIGQGAVPIEANNPIDSVADKILSGIS